MVANQANQNYWNGIAAKNTHYFKEIAIDGSMVGGLWLRTRAQCNHVEWDQMTPYDNLAQGEVEDWAGSLTNRQSPGTAYRFSTKRSTIYLIHKSHYRHN